MKMKVNRVQARPLSMKRAVEKPQRQKSHPNPVEMRWRNQSPIEH